MRSRNKWQVNMNRETFTTHIKVLEDQIAEILETVNHIDRLECCSHSLVLKHVKQLNPADYHVVGEEITLFESANNATTLKKLTLHSPTSTLVNCELTLRGRVLELFVNELSELSVRCLESNNPEPREIFMCVLSRLTDSFYRDLALGDYMTHDEDWFKDKIQFFKSEDYFDKGSLSKRFNQLKNLIQATSILIKVNSPEHNTPGESLADTITNWFSDFAKEKQ